MGQNPKFCKTVIIDGSFLHLGMFAIIRLCQCLRVYLVGHYCTRLLVLTYHLSHGDYSNVALYAGISARLQTTHHLEDDRQCGVLRVFPHFAIFFFFGTEELAHVPPLHRNLHTESIMWSLKLILNLSGGRRDNL